MGERVDARDVLDVNARTKKELRGRVVGHFERTGPDSWDDYEFVRSSEGEVDVLPGIDVQLERHGALFRMRSHGRVVRIAWVPGDDEREEAEGSPEAARRLMLERYVAPHRDDQGIGAEAFLVRKIGG